MRKTLAEIAEFVDGTVIGDGQLVITGLSGIKEAKEGDLTFVDSAKYFPLIEKTQATAIIVSKEIKAAGKSFILIDNPSYAFVQIAAAISSLDQIHPKDIHSTAVIDEGAELSEGVVVGPYAVIEKGAKIGRGTIIYSHCYIGANVVIGEGSLIYSHVNILHGSLIGQRVIIHSGAVIGSDGFGFVKVDGVYKKIPQLGIVVVEDDVEIGANSTVDRARFDKTIIGKGTKIDNLVHVAHNVTIGQNCILIALVGVSGSVRIEKNVVLAGQVGVVGHLTIGEGVVVASKSAVTKSIAPHTQVWGIPAKPQAKAKRVNASLQKLPHYVSLIRDLQLRLLEVEKIIRDKK